MKLPLAPMRRESVAAIVFGGQHCREGGECHGRAFSHAVVSTEKRDFAKMARLGSFGYVGISLVSLNWHGFRARLTWTLGIVSFVSVFIGLFYVFGGYLLIPSSNLYSSIFTNLFFTRYSPCILRRCNTCNYYPHGLMPDVNVVEAWSD